MTSTAPPIILALDPGRRCGFAHGRAGDIPYSGVVELRQKPQHRRVGLGNLIAWLHMRLDNPTTRPDIVAYEEAMNAGAWFALCKRLGIPQNSDGLHSAHEMAGIIEGLCQRHGIRCENLRRNQVVKHFTGKPHHGGREKTKIHVINAAIAAGLVEFGCKDDDRCDAVANFSFASLEFARKQVGRPVLFGRSA